MSDRIRKLGIFFQFSWQEFWRQIHLKTTLFSGLDIKCIRSIVTMDPFQEPAINQKILCFQIILGKILFIRFFLKLLFDYKCEYPCNFLKVSQHLELQFEPPEDSSWRTNGRTQGMLHLSEKINPT